MKSIRSIAKFAFVPVVYLSFLALGASCKLNTTNSFQNDQVCEGTRDYCTFVAILKKESHGCFHCHANGGEGGGEWQDFDSVDDWVAANLINRGDGEGSTIIAILKPAGDMPEGAYTPLSTSEKQKIIEYIDTL